MSFYWYAAGGIASFVVSVCATYLFASGKIKLPILDYPNERSLHLTPVPRTGGLALLIPIFIGGIIVAFATVDRTIICIVVALSLIAFTAFVDDRYGVHPSLRLLVQTISGLVVLLAGGLYVDSLKLPDAAWLWPPALGTLLALLFIVWMTNLYNFMDGMDGFAGGMTVFGFAAFAILGDLRGGTTFALLSLVIAGAAGGFLVANFPPARIFMGDTGSSTLGFLAGAFALWADRDGLFPLWISVLIFSPFIVDATVTLGQRLYRRDRIWLPHKTHYYQRLVRSGWGHRKTTLCGYVLIAACGISALLGAQLPASAQWWLIAGWIASYVVLLVAIDKRQRRVEARAGQAVARSAKMDR